MASTRKYDINKISSNQFVKVYKKEKPDLNQNSAYKNEELEVLANKFISSIQTALEQSAPKLTTNAESRIDNSSHNRIPRSVKDLHILARNLIQEQRRIRYRNQNFYQNNRPEFAKEKFFETQLNFYVGDNCPSDMVNKKVKKPKQQTDFDEEIIVNLIDKLPTDKLPGLDFIPSSIWKFLLEVDKAYLVQFFKILLKSSYFPAIFKEGKLIAFRKPNRQGFEPQNYRFITVLSTVCKLFEKFMVIKLKDSTVQSYLDQVTNQHGFMRGRSRFTALQTVHNEMLNIRRQKQYGVLIQLDIKRAFDLISWNHILSIVEKNFNNDKYILVAQLLKNRVITMNNCKRNLHRGIPQGSSCSHLLWLLGTSDLLLQLASISNVKSVAYVDDLMLVVRGNNPNELINSINQAKCVLDNWLASAGLDLSQDKCFYMQFSGSTRMNLNRIQIGNISLRGTNEIKYLGVYLNKHLDFNSQLKTIQFKVNDAIRAIRTLNLYFKGNLSIEDRLMIYRRAIIPLLTDGWTIWAPEIIGIKHFTDRLRNLQKKALVVLLDETDYYSNSQICRQHRLLPIDIELQYKLAVKIAGDKTKRKLTKKELDVIQLKVMQNNNYHF